MPLMPRGSSQPGKSHPIAMSYAMVLLIALGVLVVLHRTFGSVRIEGGLK